MPPWIHLWDPQFENHWCTQINLLFCSIDIKRHITKRGQHIMKILLVDESVSVLIDHVKGLFKLLDL